MDNNSFADVSPSASLHLTHTTADNTALPADVSSSRVPSNPLAEPVIPLKQRGVSRRGSNFSESEILMLARAWVERSEITTEQNETIFWGGVATAFKVSTGLERSPSSLKNKWSDLQRKSLKWLKALKQIEGLQPSGSTSDNLREQAMKLYQVQCGTQNEDGSVKEALPFKHISAATWLATQERFTTRLAGSAASNSGYLPTKRRRSENPTVEDEVTVDSEGEEDRAARPKGAKRIKAEKKAAAGRVEMENAILESLKSCKETSEDLLSTVRASANNFVDVLLLSHMPEGLSKDKLMEKLAKREQ